MITLNDSLSFEDDKAAYVAAVQNHLGQLKDLIIHAGAFFGDDPDYPIWEYVQEENPESATYAIINLISIADQIEDSEVFRNINKLIYSAEAEND